MSSKVELRELFHQRIKKYDEDLVKKLSHSIQSQLAQLMNDIQIKSKSTSLKTVGLYCPLRGEPVIDEDYWLKELTTFKSAYPKVKPDEMDYVVSSLNVKRSWRGDELRGENIIPDIVVCPGFWFSFKGYRVGRGKGYFDKYFSAHPNVLKVGVCFHEFYGADWDYEKHDQRCDYVVTENGIFNSN